MISFPDCDDFNNGSFEAMTAYLPYIFFVRLYFYMKSHYGTLYFDVFRCNAGNFDMVITGISQLIKKDQKNCSNEYLLLLCLQEQNNRFVIAIFFYY